MVVRRLALLPAAAAVLALGACDAPTIPEETFAYDPRLPGGLVYHWPIGATISVYVDPTGWSSLDPRAAVVEAFRQWEAVAHYRDFTLRIAETPDDADVIVHLEQAPFLVDVSECSYPDGGGSGVTFFCPTADLDELEVLPLLNGGGGRVKMDVRIGLPVYQVPENLGSLVSHEIGHVLGIGGHSPDPSDLLFAGTLVTQPSERDARTLRWVLRQPADIRP